MADREGEMRDWVLNREKADSDYIVVHTVYSKYSQTRSLVLITANCADTGHNKIIIWNLGCLRMTRIGSDN